MATTAFDELTDQQIVHAILDAERQMVQTKFLHSMDRLENTASIHVLRKQIARLRTEVRSRELAADLSKDELFRKHRGSFSKSESSNAPVEGEEKGGFLSGIVDKLVGND